MGKTDKAGAVLLFVVVVLALVFGIMRHDDEPKDDPQNKREVANSEKRGQRTDLNALRRRSEKGKRKGKATKEPPSNGAKLRRDENGERQASGTPGRKSGRRVSTPPAKLGGTPGSTVSNGPAKEAKPTKRPAGDWPKTHEVASGEVLGAICARYYNTTRMVRHVLDANPGLDPKKLRPGDSITLPAPVKDLVANAGSSDRPAPSTGTERTTAAPAGGRPSFISSAYLRRNAGGKASVAAREADDGERTYTVRSGDILSKIAARELGSSRHVNRLIEANKDLIKNPDKLKEGWVLVLPNVN